MTDATRPTHVAAVSGEGALSITWADGRVQRLPFVFLRGACRCAKCVNELTGERMIDPAAIPADIAVARIEKVGHYAIRIVWSDGHDTGLYTWRRLRAMDPDTGDDGTGSAATGTT